jgi:hypothetical protein
MEDCNLCGHKCGHAAKPLVSGWKFYKTFLVVLVLPLSGFILGIVYASRFFNDSLSFIFGCGFAVLGFIPALYLEKRGVSHGPAQSKLHQTASRVSVPRDQSPQKGTPRKTTRR